MARKSNGIFKSNGVWTWNSTNLEKKIVKTGEDDCWAWIGSTGPQTNLFGARKNDVAQMTQARRLWYMDVFGKSADDLQIKHTCGNPYCMNFRHFIAKPNNRLYRMDGIDREIQREKPRQQQPASKAKIIEVKQQQRWWTI